MKRLVVLAGVQLLSPAANADSTQSTPTDALAEEIQTEFLATDCSGTVPRLVELTSRADFAQAVDARQQALFLGLLAQCMAATQQFEVALDYANRAAKADSGSFGAHATRMTLALIAGRPGDGVDAIEALGEIRPAFVRSLNREFIDQLLKAAGSFDGTGALQLRVYDALGRAGWAPQPPSSGDDLRFEHGRLLVEHGRFDDARQRLEPVADPVFIVAIRSDREFDELRKNAEFEAQLDFETSVKRSLARAKSSMEQNSRSMAAVRNYATLLADSNRFTEILGVTQEALDRHANDPAAYDDAADQLNWLLNQRSTALYSLGKSDEGRELFRHSLQLSGIGRASDANTTNFASHLVWEGRAREALALLPQVANPSPYLRAWVEAMRACAAGQLEEAATTEVSLEYLRIHETENPAALSTALLCANELDEAAALMIRRLGSRDMRRHALAALQIHAMTGLDELPFRKLLLERFQRLREREDVRAAVESVGRIEAIPVIASKVF